MISSLKIGYQTQRFKIAEKQKFTENEDGKDATLGVGHQKSVQWKLSKQFIDSLHNSTILDYCSLITDAVYLFLNCQTGS